MRTIHMLATDQWRDPNEDRSVMLERINSNPRMLAALRGDMPQ
jgi:hypothetical protein